MLSRAASGTNTPHACVTRLRLLPVKLASSSTPRTRSRNPHDLGSLQPQSHGWSSGAHPDRCTLETTPLEGQHLRASARGAEDWGPIAGGRGCKPSCAPLALLQLQAIQVASGCGPALRLWRATRSTCKAQCSQLRGAGQADTAATRRHWRGGGVVGSSGTGTGREPEGPG